MRISNFEFLFIHINEFFHYESTFSQQKIDNLSFIFHRKKIQKNIDHLTNYFDTGIRKQMKDGWKKNLTKIS